MKKTVTRATYLAVATLCLQLATVEFATAKDSPAAAPAIVSLDSDAALRQLKAGNERFLTGTVRKDGQSAGDIQRLSMGQAPNAIVLSCSDSRVPPETVFDQKLGEMFTVRTAGESLSPQSIGSMEFAIEKLGTHLLVVLGHTNCGAIKAAVETLGGGGAGSENLDQLVGDIHPRIRAVVKGKSNSKNFEAEAWANTEGIAKDLKLRSKLILAAVNSGKIKIVVGLYDLSTGKVTFDKTFTKSR